MNSLFIVRLSDGFTVTCSGAVAALAYLRRGGARLVSGDRAALLAFDADEQERLQDALRGQDDPQAGHAPPVEPQGQDEAR